MAVYFHRPPISPDIPLSMMLRPFRSTSPRDLRSPPLPSLGSEWGFDPRFIQRYDGAVWLNGNKSANPQKEWLGDHKPMYFNATDSRPPPPGLEGVVCVGYVSLHKDGSGPTLCVVDDFTTLPEDPYRPPGLAPVEWTTRPGEHRAQRVRGPRLPPSWAHAPSFLAWPMARGLVRMKNAVCSHMGACHDGRILLRMGASFANPAYIAERMNHKILRATLRQTGPVLALFQRFGHSWQHSSFDLLPRLDLGWPLIESGHVRTVYANSNRMASMMRWLNPSSVREVTSLPSHRESHRGHVASLWAEEMWIPAVSIPYMHLGCISPHQYRNLRPLMHLDSTNRSQDVPRIITYVQRPGISDRKLESGEGLATALRKALPQGWTLKVRGSKELGRSVGNDRRIFSRTRILIGCHGGALANARFMAPGGHLIEMGPYQRSVEVGRNGRPCYLCMALALGLDYWSVPLYPMGWNRKETGETPAGFVNWDGWKVRPKELVAAMVHATVQSS